MKYMLEMPVMGYNNETSATSILTWLNSRITSPWHMPCVSLRSNLSILFSLGDGQYSEYCPMGPLHFKILFNSLGMFN